MPVIGVSCVEVAVELVGMVREVVVAVWLVVQLNRAPIGSVQL